MGDRRGILKALGPGFLFAAVSVGVSHLVQSTRAGAYLGFSLVPVILLAMVLKYPLFEFGQRYAAATGTSLLDGYRKQGRWALVVYILLTLGTMFTVLAAVTAITTGLAIQLTGIVLPLWQWSAIIIGVCAILIALGRCSPSPRWPPSSPPCPACAQGACSGNSSGRTWRSSSRSSGGCRPAWT